MGHEEAAGHHRHCAGKSWAKEGKRHENAVRDRINGDHLHGTDPLHQPGRSKSADQQQHQVTRQKPTRLAFCDGCVLLHVGNERRPGGHLRAYIEKLRDDRKPELGVHLEFAEAANIIAFAYRSGTRNRGEPCNANYQCKKQHAGTQRNIGGHHSHDFNMQISGVGSCGLHLSNFARGRVLHRKR